MQQSPGRWLVHTPMTDPASLAAPIEELPTEVAALNQVVQGLIVHCAWLSHYGDSSACGDGGRSLHEALTLAESEARAALRLDAANSGAHSALAWVFADLRGDAASAMEQADRAIALNPNDPTGYAVTHQSVSKTTFLLYPAAIGDITAA
jgi:hypothetical protein